MAHEGPGNRAGRTVLNIGEWDAEVGSRHLRLGSPLDGNPGVGPLYQLIQVSAQRQGELGLTAGHGRELSRQLEVVGHQGSDPQGAIGLKAHGQYPSLFGEPLRHQSDGVRVDVLIFQVEDGDSELEAENGDQGFPGDDAQGHQVVQEAPAPLMSVGPGLGELVVGDEPCFGQHQAYPFLE